MCVEGRGGDVWGGLGGERPREWKVSEGKGEKIHILLAVMVKYGSRVCGW